MDGLRRLHERFCECIKVARGANGQAHHGRAAPLCVRSIIHRRRVFAEVEPLRIGNEAHDLHGLAARRAPMRIKSLPQWVPIGQEPPDERLVHERHRLRGGVIRMCEITTADQRRAHGAQEARRDSLFEDGRGL